MGRKKGKKDAINCDDFDTALESLRISEAPAVKVEQREGLGRVLVATRQFKTGDIVLQEAPFCVFKNSWLDLALLYCKMPEVDRAKLLEFQHMSSEEEVRHIEYFKRDALANFKEMLCMPEVRLLLDKCCIDERLAFKLCTIVSINAHQYIGGSTPYSETTSIQPQMSALFYIASKMTHSCNPNCSYTSKHKHGHLVYFATRPIACGDLLTFSYIENTYSPTSQRRSILMRSKDFFCQCEKCASADWADSYPCARGGCRGLCCPTMMSIDSPCEWSCTVCGGSTGSSSSYVDSAKEIFSRFNAVDKTTTTPNLHLEISELIEHIKPLISPVNHKLIEMYLSLSTIQASDAECWKKVGNQHRWLESKTSSTKVLLQAISTIECLDAKCATGASCTKEHHPVHTLCHFALWGIMDFIETKRAIPRQLKKYVTLLEMCYGYDDNDVCKIRNVCNLNQKSKQR